MLNALCSRLTTGPTRLAFNKSRHLKLLRIMRIMMFLLTAACITASATGNTQGLTMTMKNAPLEKVFSTIEKQGGYYFTYTKELLEGTKNVSLDVKNASIKEVMDLCVKDQPISYEIMDKAIIIKKRTQINGVMLSSNEAPPLDVHGRVVDEKGEPVAGVTVTVKGSNKRTASDNNGEFTLTGVSDDATLVFTSVNMETFEIKVSGRSNLDINLKSKVTTLGAVNVQVATGYQKITKERFVGSFQQMDSQAFHSRPGMNILLRLDGRVNSVFFQKKGSSQLPQIMVRGLSTIPILPGGTGSTGSATGTSANPLIVVDNFPMPESFRLDNINPNDVESITVLTDAAAASIWGARAGNGVIVVTTKRGKYNQRFQVNVSSNVTVEQKPDLYYYPQVTPSQYIDMEQYAFSKGAYDAALSNTTNFPAVSPVVEILDQQRKGLLTPKQAQDQIDALRNIDVRQQQDKYIYQNAVRQQHYLSVNGGTNLLSYQISGGYNRSLNNVQTSKPDQQYTINSNTSFKPVRNLEIQTGFNLALGDVVHTNVAGIGGYPYSRLADEEGHALPTTTSVRSGYVDTVGGGKLLDWYYRPLDELKLANSTSTSRYIRLNAGLNYHFTSWLQGNFQYQYQNTFGHSRSYSSLQTYAARSLINQFTDLAQVSPNLRYPVPMGGILNLSDNLVKDYNLRANLVVNKNLGIDHQLNGLVGWELSDAEGGYNSSSTIYGYDDVTGTYRGTVDYLTFYTLAYAPSTGGKVQVPYPTGYTEGGTTRFVSVFANASDTYKNRYTLYASARRDGANLFGVSTNNKWKPLWSAGAGWELSKEAFYHLSWLPYLKLRASYGYTGNSNNTIAGIFTMNYLPIVDPLTGLPFARPDAAPNSSLKWERTGITNLAADFQVFKNSRLSGSFEIYRKNSKDVIAAAPMPPSSGVTVFVKNYAELKTDGYEISLNSRNIEGAISWTTAAGWSHSKTTVTKLFTTLGHTVNDFINYNLNAYPGQVIFGLSSYRWAGLDPLTGDPEGYLNGQVSKNYSGISNDSIQHQVFHGSSLPLSMAFLRNTISWKGFSVSFNITGRFQYYFREPAIDINNAVNLSTDFFSRWQKPGDEATTNIPSIYYPIPGAVSSRNIFYQYAELHVKRADNIRLQDVNFAYQWTNKGKKSIPFQNATIFLYPNNLNWIIWRLEDSKWDPDFAGGNNPGIGQPIPKTWTAGITLGF